MKFHPRTHSPFERALSALLSALLHRRQHESTHRHRSRFFQVRAHIRLNSGRDANKR